MKFYSSLLAGAFLLGAPLALTACETETQREVEADGDVDYDTEVGIDGNVQAETDQALDEAGAELYEAGREIRAGAEEVK